MNDAVLKQLLQHLHVIASGIRQVDLQILALLDDFERGPAARAKSDQNLVTVLNQLRGDAPEQRVKVRRCCLVYWDILERWLLVVNLSAVQHVQKHMSLLSLAAGQMCRLVQFNIVGGDQFAHWNRVVDFWHV